MESKPCKIRGKNQRGARKGLRGIDNRKNGVKHQRPLASLRAGVLPQSIKSQDNKGLERDVHNLRRRPLEPG